MTGYQYSNSDILAEEAIGKTKSVSQTEIPVFKPDPKKDFELFDSGDAKLTSLTPDLDDLKPIGFTPDTKNALGKSDWGGIPDRIAFEPIDSDVLGDLEPLIGKSDIEDYDISGALTSKNLDGSFDTLLFDTDKNKPNDVLGDYLPKTELADLPKNWDKTPFVVDDVKDSIYGDIKLPSSLETSRDSLLKPPTTSKTKALVSESRPWIPKSYNPNSNYVPAWQSLVKDSALTTTSKTKKKSERSPLISQPNSTPLSKKPIGDSKISDSKLTPVKQHFCLFDKEYYLAENPYVAKLNIEPVNHYMSIGKQIGLSPSEVCENDLTTNSTSLTGNNNGLANTSFYWSSFTDT